MASDFCSPYHAPEADSDFDDVHGTKNGILMFMLRDDFVSKENRKI